MRRVRQFVLVILAAISAAACAARPGGEHASLRPAGERGTACPAVTDRVLRASRTESEPLSAFSSAEPDIPLVTYRVDGDQIANPEWEKVPAQVIGYQADHAGQEAAWHLFTTLIPAAQRVVVAQYQVITDGPGGVLSAVEQTPFDPARWTLEVDVADAADRRNLVFTLLHEFGHLLTLSPEQVPPDRQVFLHPYNARVMDRAVEACPDFFPGEGCSLPDSYLNIFFKRFWSDLYGEWQTLDRQGNPSRRDAGLESFYARNQDRFVDSYAATSPMEDVAESWAYFVLSPQPVGESQRDQKLRFFYDYPELVTLRSSILSNLCATAP